MFPFIYDLIYYPTLGMTLVFLEVMTTIIEFMVFYGVTHYVLKKPKLSARNILIISAAMNAGSVVIGYLVLNRAGYNPYSAV